MKVMCIKDGSWINARTHNPTECKPSYGEICTVTESFRHEGKLYYSLHEHPLSFDGKIRRFLSTNFIPCSDIDELELVNEKEIVNAD